MATLDAGKNSTGENIMDVERPNIIWPTVPLATLPIVDATMEETAEDFIRRASTPRAPDEKPFYSTSANGQVIALCHQDAQFDSILRQADQIHADGMSLVIFSRHFSARALRERIATTDLVHTVAKRAEETGARFYFLGGSEDVNRTAVAEMQKLYPRLVFAGRQNGYFKEHEEDAVVKNIVASQPDILWIGFGIPLEQRFVARNLNKLAGIAVIKTCGGLFDFIAGKNSRAPQWMQDMGLEWLYRAMLEPRRLGKRYLLTNPVAIYAMLKHRDRMPNKSRSTTRTDAKEAKKSN
ncbi:WecB/TagA/CpsF family glycosyltransferase [Rhizobium sp. Td3]|nr:WecB/TagA/CpsF family glycosyltransferase [Rhizobium sp. RM]TMV22777.1 WecB/TagA/CpsF family glycosyltransferase [Rhizobium sp. Td3]